MLQVRLILLQSVLFLIQELLQTPTSAILYWVTEVQSVQVSDMISDHFISMQLIRM